MPGHGPTLGVDFGTSNSAAGWLVDGAPKVIPLAPGEPTLPSTFFFDFETRETLIGHPANAALLSGAEGRFMRALKRVLGTSLMHEPRQILNERVTFVDVIGRFLQEIKSRAEAETGQSFAHVLAGRPVVFHKEGDPREAKAEADLRACYHAAGFEQVAFMAEPEAAAIASGALSQTGALGLIVDVGGGTSDFSLFRSDPDGVEIIANHGVRIGGTDFDRSVSIEYVMPLLGKGSLLRNTFGAGTAPAPSSIFNDLATWEMIPFLYNQSTRRSAHDMRQVAVEPAKLRRLETVLIEELGHDLAFAVEAGKIAANSGRNDARITLGAVEGGLEAALPPRAMAETLLRHGEGLAQAADRTLAKAGLDRQAVDRVIYVGGSSLMTLVSDRMARVFPRAEHSFSEVFTAVTDGLAIAAARSS